MKQHLAELPLLTALKLREDLIMYLCAAREAISAVLLTGIQDEFQPRSLLLRLVHLGGAQLGLPLPFYIMLRGHGWGHCLLISGRSLLKQYSYKTSEADPPPTRRRHVDDSRSTLSQPRPDVVAESLMPSLDKSRQPRFMLATPSPRSKHTSLKASMTEADNGIQIKKQRSTDKEDMSQPWLCEETYMFTIRICNSEVPKQTRMPTNIKTYDRTGDPEDHLKIFQTVAKIERWAMSTWCHMFNSTLIGSARVWFDTLPPESIDSYVVLRKAFLGNSLRQKKYIKDPVEINH
nr:reverse transcriptase domain-containing protein [Tanacetum cinerariifolium]